MSPTRWPLRSLLIFLTMIGVGGLIAAGPSAAVGAVLVVGGVAGIWWAGARLR